MRKTALFLLFYLITFTLFGCNAPKNKSNGNLDVTQAYQTVEAKLTKALAKQTSTTPTEKTTETPITLTTTETIFPTNTQPSTATIQPALSQTENSKSCDQAAAAYPKIDITIDDDTKMAPGEEFTKIWRIVNVGTCTWTPDYQVVFFSGEQMNAPDNIPLEKTVAPNQSIDIGIDMKAPNEPGTYQGNWKLQNSKGELFGIGPHGEAPFWVRIVVVENTPVSPTATITSSPTPEVLVHSALTITAGTKIDLDTSILNNNDADVLYQTTNPDSPLHQLIPQGNAKFSIFGSEQPDFTACQMAATVNTPIDITQIPPGTYFCYRTGLSLPGWLRLDTINTNNNSLFIEFTTWVIP